MNEEGFGGQFQKSVLSYSSRMKQRFIPACYPMFNLNGTLDEHLEELSKKWGFADPSHVTMYRCLIHHHMDQYYRLHKWIVEQCESPIEIAMAFALLIHGYYYDTEIRILPGHGEHMPEDCICTLTPQAKIGDYRVDFLLCHWQL